MKFICPLIVVDDIAISRKFYEEVLGQKVQYDFGENVTFEGGLTIHLKTHFASLIDLTPHEILQKSHDGELYFEDDNLDNLAEKLKGMHNIEYVHEMREQPWGQRVIRFYDPDGHIIEVGEPMESAVRRFLSQGLTVEETAKRTSMPVEFVRQCS
jgi:catechol 2,3-dioxygenase-like lactoylglutathione lyase family enzyme